MRQHFYVLGLVIMMAIGPLAARENEMPLVPSTMTGHVVSVSQAGGAICETAGTEITGNGLQDVRARIGKFFFTISPTATVPKGVTYTFQDFEPANSSGQAIFNLPLVGFTHTVNYTISNFQTTAHIMSFRLATSTPSQDNPPAGNCNIVYDLSFKRGLPPKVKDFLKSFL